MCVSVNSSFRNTLLGLIVTSVLFLVEPVVYARQGTLDRKPYRFDAGGHAATINTFPLQPADMYDATRGYGWIKAPKSALERWNLKRFRSSFEQTTVIAKELSFRADIPAGTWWLTCWIDAGWEDSSSLALSLNGKSVAYRWQPFARPAELRSEIQRIYRVLQASIIVHSQGLEFGLEGVKDSVRLLGFSLIPEPGIEKPAHDRILSELAAKGTLRASGSLDDILASLTALLRENADDVFAAYWLQQVHLLRTAELLYQMRGWEWANDTTGLGLFDRLHQCVMILDGLLGQKHPESFPLYDRASFLRARLLYWLGVERGGEFEIEWGKKYLADLLVRHPSDTLLRMYNGELIDTPDPWDAFIPPADAPAWAVAQWETLNRLRGIARWWTLVRQTENGELGGKFGDDVEILRSWTALVLSGDTLVQRGWRKLADGVWKSGQISDGYAAQVSDVEHSSEFIADTAPMMSLISDDPAYIGRLRYSVGHFKDLWTGISEGGRRFFRSAWYSSTAMDTVPPKNRDVHYNSRSTKAVRYFAWRTEDSVAVRTLHEWARAWAAVALQTGKSKPRGIFPASVRFPDEAFNGDGATWFKADMMWDYFDWGGGVSMYDLLLFTWTMTRDDTLLQPLIETLQFIRRHEGVVRTPRRIRLRDGSEEWAAAKLISLSDFWCVVGTWRFLTNNTSFDDLIRKYGTAYSKFRMSQNESDLVPPLNDILEQIRFNTPLLTSEVMHTDRVFITRSGGRGDEQLTGMITGNESPESLSPYVAVTWSGGSDDLTYLVRNTGTTTLSASLYSFGAKVERVELRLWQLDAGTYTITMTSSAGEPETRSFKVCTRGERLNLSIAPRSLATIRITPSTAR